MTNKEYKRVRDAHENATELYTFEKWNGISIYPSRYMDNNELKELRKEYKEMPNTITFDEFGDRARCKVVNGGLLLVSYKTTVCGVFGGEFVKLWGGYSVTTLKHINALRGKSGLHKLTKKEWIEMPVSDWNGNEIINATTGEVFTI